MRIALGVEYDGSHYHGWQYQEHTERTVQACVERGVSAVANGATRVVCAGRTDSGVHASGQVIHFDTEAVRDERAWVYGINANMPKDIAILWARVVDGQFHARFSALRRSYRYIIYQREVRPTFLAHRVSWSYRRLDIEAMRAAAGYLVGEHDFTSYRAVGCQAKSPVRTVHRLELQQHGDFIYFDVEANAFLHHMIRNFAGVLMKIGAGEAEPVWAKEVLEARDRAVGGVTAQPHGLYLTSIVYPEEFALPVATASPTLW